MAFIVVHAGISVGEYKRLTLREYQALADAVTEKGPNL